MQEDTKVIKSNLNLVYSLMNKIKEIDLSLITPIFTLIILWVIIGIKNPAIISFVGLSRVFKTAIPILICSFGVSHVIRMGCIDLSIEGQVALSGVLVSYFVKNGMNNHDYGMWAIVIALLATSIFGILNGLVHTKVRIPSFIGSFGMGAIASGISILIFRGNPINILDKGFRNISLGSHFGIKNIIIIALVMYLILIYKQKKTVIGTYINAIGGDETLAEMVGIPVDKFKVIAFGIAGLCYGVVGVLLASRLGSGMESLGSDLLMYSIGGVILGGTSILGGNGGVTRTLIGVSIITTLKTGLIVFRISPYYQDAVIGFVVIIAVLFSVKRGILEIVK